MSNFGAPGQFDEAGELERQMQGEYRRRQALQQAGHSQVSHVALSALARARQPDYASSAQQHLSMLGAAEAQAAAAASPYYARPTAHPHHAAAPPPPVTNPYTRVTNPYAGLAEARAAQHAVQAYQQAAAARAAPAPQPPPPDPHAGALGHPSDPHAGALAHQIYQHAAAQQQQRRQQQQQAAAVQQAQAAAAANYSYGTPAPPAPPVSAYAAAPSPYAQQAGPSVAQQSALDQQQQQRYAAAAYGLPAQPPAASPAAPSPYGAAATATTDPYVHAAQQAQAQAQAVAAQASRPSYAAAGAAPQPPPPPPQKSPVLTPRAVTSAASSASKAPPPPPPISTPSSNGAAGGHDEEEEEEEDDDDDEEEDVDDDHTPITSKSGGKKKKGDPSDSSSPRSRKNSIGDKETPDDGLPLTTSSDAVSPSSLSGNILAGKGSTTPARVATKDGKIIVGGKTTYFTGWVPLGLDDDKYWLSELQVYLRSNFAEAFGATEEDIAAPMHGRNKPIALGQVGIRCKHCKNDNPAERGQQATSYPSLISGVYNSVQQMLRLHLDCCLSMPPEVRSKIEALKISCSSRGGRKQYWVDSARRLGLVDTPHGIHFGRDPYGPLPPLTGPSVNSKEGRRKRMLKASAEAAANKKEENKEDEPTPTVDDRPLVFDEDRPLISDYLYLTLEQMAPCTLMEADRVGCYKTRKVGFPGLACKHCVGQAGCGRYFPASEASLSQTTTSQTIMNHVRNCRRCPNEIRENLEIMKRNRMGPDGKRADKPKHGGRKVFFHRLWCRIQGLEISEDVETPKEPRKRKGRAKKGGGGRRKKVQAAVEGSDVEDSGDEAGGAQLLLSSEEEDDDEETESEAESEVSEGGEEETSTPASKSKKRSAVVSSGRKKPSQAPWFDGCVRLTKTDDPHWLSEMEVFARSDLVEVFSLDNKRDGLDGYGGRKEPAVGQVGIRCVFCKSLDPVDRPAGCVSFPDSVSTVHVKVTDMIRLHFPQCPSLPDDARETFKSLRGFDAKVANDDAQAYWIDSARDIGLANVPPGGINRPGAWGITFRRDPLQPSPADELDLENNDANGAASTSAANGKNSLVLASDRGLCTDQVMLLLRQVQPCRFKKSDRRAGPGYRGRDRSMGFPGLSCKHCAGQNTLGRYFPVSAKNLTDATANSLQTHVMSCSYCPEPIRASLAYLGHRSILQKAELRGCWKKIFFKKAWDRLHVERKWTSIDDEEGAGSGSEAGGGRAMEAEPAEAEVAKPDDADSDSEKEELGDQMNALIKAAAIWLTEQDAATDSARAANRNTKGRSLPSKRAAQQAQQQQHATNSINGGDGGVGSGKPSRSVRGDTSLPTKRRRVHF